MSNRKVIVGFREGDAFKQDIDLTEEFQKLKAEIAELKEEIINLGESYRYLQIKCESQRAEIEKMKVEK